MTSLQLQFEIPSSIRKVSLFRLNGMVLALLLIFTVYINIYSTYCFAQESAPITPGTNVAPLADDNPNTNADEDIRIISRTRTTERNRATSTRSRFFTKRKTFSKDSDPSSRTGTGTRSAGVGSNQADTSNDQAYRRGTARAETFPSIQAKTKVNDTPFGFDMSPWGGFEPGSWRRTRTTATTLDGTKKMKSVTEAKTTLLRIEHNCIVLKHEITIKMGAVNHAAPPEEIRLDFFGAPIQEGQTKQVLQPSTVMIARKVIPCQLCQFEKNSEHRQDTSVVWYSPTIAPYVLQRENRCYDIDPSDPARKTLVSFSQTTISRTSAHLFIESAFSTYRSETITQKGLYNSRTTTIHSMRIPGHLIKESTSEKDPSGKMLYQSETVLLDFFAEKN